MPMTNEEKLAKVEAQKAKTDRYHAQLVRVAQAEAEIPGIWETGQVSKKKLAGTYGISVATVTRILDTAGLEQTRYRKLRKEDRAEILGLFKSNVSIDQIAAHMGVSRNTVRRVLLDAGLVQPGHRAPRRSAEDYELIRAFDAEARARFNGAGLYNLGMGLRQWDAKQAVKTRDENEAKVEAQPTPPSDPRDSEGTPVPPPVFSAEPSPPQPVDDGPIVDPETDFPTWQPDPEPSEAPTPEPTPEPVVQHTPPPAGLGENLPRKNDDDAPIVAGPFANAGPKDDNLSY